MSDNVTIEGASPFARRVLVISSDSERERTDALIDFPTSKGGPVYAT